LFPQLPVLGEMLTIRTTVWKGGKMQPSAQTPNENAEKTIDSKKDQNRNGNPAVFICAADETGGKRRRVEGK